VKGPQHGLILEVPAPPLPIWKFPVPDKASWIGEAGDLSRIRLRNAHYYMTENRDVYIFGGVK